MINKDDILRTVDYEVCYLLTRSAQLRQQYERLYENDMMFETRIVLLDMAINLEGAALSTVADAQRNHLITWTDYRTIRNIIDHIGTGVRMEDRLW